MATGAIGLGDLASTPRVLVHDRLDHVHLLRPWRHHRRWSRPFDPNLSWRASYRGLAHHGASLSIADEKATELVSATSTSVTGEIRGCNL